MAFVEENDETVGRVVSIVMLIADEAADVTPLFVCVEVTDHVPSASVPKSQLDCAVAVNVHVTFAEPAFVAVTVTVAVVVAAAVAVAEALAIVVCQ